MLGILLSNSPFKIFIPFICLFTSYVYRRIIAHTRSYAEGAQENHSTHMKLCRRQLISHIPTQGLLWNLLLG